MITYVSVRHGGLISVSGLIHFDCVTTSAFQVGLLGVSAADVRGTLGSSLQVHP